MWPAFASGRGAVVVGVPSWSPFLGHVGVGTRIVGIEGVPVRGVAELAQSMEQFASTYVLPSRVPF